MASKISISTRQKWLIGLGLAALTGGGIALVISSGRKKKKPLATRTRNPSRKRKTEFV